MSKQLQYTEIILTIPHRDYLNNGYIIYLSSFLSTTWLEWPNDIKTSRNNHFFQFPPNIIYNIWCLGSPSPPLYIGSLVLVFFMRVSLQVSSYTVLILFIPSFTNSNLYMFSQMLLHKCLFPSCLKKETIIHNIIPLRG